MNLVSLVQRITTGPRLSISCSQCLVGHVRGDQGDGASWPDRHRVGLIRRIMANTAKVCCQFRRILHHWKDDHPLTTAELTGKLLFRPDGRGSSYLVHPARHGGTEKTRSSGERRSGLRCPAYALCAGATVASTATRNGPLLGQTGRRRATAIGNAYELRYMLYRLMDT